MSQVKSDYIEFLYLKTNKKNPCISEAFTFPTIQCYDSWTKHRKKKKRYFFKET